MTAQNITPPYPVFLDRDGTPLDNGFVFIGVENLEPVTNPLPVFWDEALSIPAAQPIRTINGYPSRSGSPSALFSNSNFSITVKDKKGHLVYTEGSVENITDVNLRNDISSTSDITKGDALVGVKRTLTSALSTTQHKMNEGLVIDVVSDFGADPTGITDATTAFNAAIKAGIDAGAGSGDYGTQLSCTIISGKPGAKFKILGTIIVPQNFEINLNGAMLTGSGYAITDNICFQTGYISAGIAVSNDGTPENTRIVHGLKIRNVNFVNFQRALNLWNVNDGCFFENITFYNCLYSVYSVYSFYSGFRNLFTRGSAGGAINGAYHFDYYTNVVELDSIFCQGRVLGFEFFHAVDGLQIRNCSVEGGTYGMKFGSETNLVTLDNCYFEALTNLVIDFSTAAAHRNVTIDKCFFNGLVGPILNGVQMGSGCTWGRGNNVTVNTLWVTSHVYVVNDLVSVNGVNYNCLVSHTSGTFATDLSGGKWAAQTVIYAPDGQSNYLIAVFQDQTITSPTAASVLKSPSNNLAKTTNIAGGRTIATDGVGNQTVVAAAPFLFENPIPLNYFGKCADTAIGVTTGVPFCSVSGTTSIVVDTKIAYDDFVFGLFSLSFKEAGSVYHTMSGRFTGLTAYLDNSDGGKTCTVTAQAAADGKLYIRLTFATFGVAIANTYGIVRIA